MPFKSKAQRRKFAQLLVEGKISDETYEEWNRSTGKKVLPERVKRKERTRSGRWAKARTQARGKSRAKAGTRSKPRASSKRKGKTRLRRKAK
jgi:hypothetical protein